MKLLSLTNTVCMTCFLSCSLTMFAGAPEPITGWRGDGTGRFPAATPPQEWSKDSDNIMWKVEIGKGYSSPVLCQPRNVLLMAVEPSDLVCVEAETGKELWRKSVSYADALGEAAAQKIAETHEKLNDLRKAANSEYNDLRKSDPDSPKLEELNEKRKEAESKRKTYEQQYPQEKRGGAGNAAATVVCDGERVYAIFGTGLVAGFSLDGERLWVKHLEAPKQGFGHSASPLLAAGNLIVHIDKLRALDLKTGEERWQTETSARFGSPIVATINGTDVIITASGDVVDASAGEILAEKQFRLSNNSPLLHEGVLYVHESGKVKALQLPKTLDTPFALTELWEERLSSNQRMASALYHNGLLYAGGRRGILDVTDAKTGELVYRERLNIGELFSSPTLAGDLIYFGGRDGKMVVFRPGRKFQRVAVNQTERCSTLPLFHGSRMYLRTDKSLYCIGK